MPTFPDSHILDLITASHLTFLGARRSLPWPCEHRQFQQIALLSFDGKTLTPANAPKSFFPTCWNSGSLAGKVAIVTGGAKGIGQAISIALASAGASVVIGYAGDEAGARETVATSIAAGADASKLESFKGDISKSDSVRDLFAAAVEKFGGVDIVV
ncbi:hypothetical protein BDK51DRAFT_47720 [Blyttiomyces helicus]|uniref:NAD(P)-binding protein n=1 Tax=Blyttiomyces helicus TaxID=388810 RepID=A0A4V1ISC3_9FUNG|nr:hypothetical protein BDK51DRAFT_47720 [Blyttiomyces helicus]|eukprot:RKO93057.1 hypothetical protein BDK51DRAFT_47720 [Blyttiomyces helicus]